MVNTNSVYRAQPILYDWVPANLPQGEMPISPVDLCTNRVPGGAR